MAVVRLGSRNEVVIPKKLRDELGVRPGDMIEITVRAVDHFPETDEPIGPETEAGIRAGLDDLANGRVSDPLRTDDELRAHFDRLKKQR